MASDLLKIHIQTTVTGKPQTPFPLTKTLSFPSLPFPTHHYNVSSPSSLLHKSKICDLCIKCSLSSSTPPTTKEAAIHQAKVCLSTTLEKPLNNVRLTSKLRRLKQPRFRLEIPVIDDSPASLSQLALEVFRDLPIKRKGSPVNVLIIWPNLSFVEAALKAFEPYPSNPIEHVDISSLSNGDTRILSSADVTVFLAPEASQLAFVKTAADSLYPRPVVIFNPRWAFEDETGFKELSGFVGSFEVIYSFMGLEVKGVLSNRKGVIFKCVRDGVVSGEKWNVLVEEEGELKVVSTFKARPSIGEVENVLYNLMAMNSPVTKSVRFLRDLVSNVTGKK
ncbi:hypothetical protein FNV43_RR03974 [Rhamnella rubrinervis]|uniref:DUF1995 domain-containing protein n=1 Tax=Rhamnella rubrinervis TaxID=2594499 RepID=A0A8K0HJU1_9ROSA|nr:hypothetical protein FNV43_RR03974 [Rhamnella rubrinervis]